MIIINQEEIKKFIESRGGTIDRDWSYKRSNEKFPISCGNGHKWMTSWNVIQQGHWCPLCAKYKNEMRRESVRRQYESRIRDFVSSKKWKLDQNWKYINNSTKFWLECSKGHRWQAIWNNLRKGCDCPYCAGRMVDENEVKKFIKGKGGTVSEDWSFISAKTPFVIKCSSGHYFLSCWDKIRIGHWCSFCYEKDKSNRKKIEELVRLKSGSLDCNWEYDKLEFNVRCSEGHVWKTNWNKLKLGSWCPICKGTKSENDFRKVMEEIFSAPFPRKKPEWLINPETNRRLELDGYNQDLKIAFEYQGPYHFEGHWLQDEVKVQRKRDQIKIEECLKKGIALIIMPYWVSKENWRNEIINQYTKSKEISIWAK